MDKGFLGFGILDGTLLTGFKPPPGKKEPWDCPNCGNKSVHLITVNPPTETHGSLTIVWKQYACGECGWSYPHIPGQTSDYIKISLREKYP